MSNEFALVVPDVEATTQEVEAKLAVSDAQKTATANAMEQRAESIMSVDMSDLNSRREIRAAIDALGQGTTASSASNSSLMATSLKSLAESDGYGKEISGSLSDLAIRMKRLDPSHIDFARKGFLAKLYDPVERYFEQFKSARSEIETVMVSLKRGRDTLAADNVELERQEVSLLKDSQTLAKEIEVADQLQASLVTAIEKAESTGEDPEKVRFVRQEVLFPLEQKRQDMQTLLAVNQQGIVAMSVLRENNRALMTNIDRTSQISLRALDTGVMIQRALHDQKQQMEKVKMVGEVTESIIRGNAEALRTQGAEIQKQSGEAMIDPAVIKEAFEQVFAALEEGDAYREAAIPRMQATIAELQEVTTKGEARLQRLSAAGRLANSD